MDADVDRHEERARAGSRRARLRRRIGIVARLLVFFVPLALTVIGVPLVRLLIGAGLALVFVEGYFAEQMISSRQVMSITVGMSAPYNSRRVTTERLHRRNRIGLVGGRLFVLLALFLPLGVSAAGDVPWLPMSIGAGIALAFVETYFDEQRARQSAPVWKSGDDSSTPGACSCSSFPLCSAWWASRGHSR